MRTTLVVALVATACLCLGIGVGVRVFLDRAFASVEIVGQR